MEVIISRHAAKRYRQRSHSNSVAPHIEMSKLLWKAITEQHVKNTKPPVVVVDGQTLCLEWQKTLSGKEVVYVGSYINREVEVVATGMVSTNYYRIKNKIKRRLINFIKDL